MQIASFLRGHRLPAALTGCLLFVGCTSGTQDNDAAATPTTNYVSPSVEEVSQPVLTSDATTALTHYVDNANPAAVDSGIGTSSAPYKTLGYGLTQLQLGETLLIRSGTYRETLDFKLSTALRAAMSATITKPVTTISAAAGAIVVIKGSDIVQGWSWVSPNVFVKRNWTTNSQQVFVDGLPLQQIGGSIFGGFPGTPNNAHANILSNNGGIWPGRVAGTQTSLVDNSFYYDATSQSLYIKVPFSALTGHVVEVSVRPYGIFGSDVYDLAIANVQVMHSNTTATMQNGAVTFVGSRLLLDKVDVKFADGAGFDITGNHNVIRNVSAVSCGQIGIKMRGNNAQLLNSVASYNNTRGFNKWWEAGGAKFVGAGGLSNSLISGNRLYFNTGDGLWFDSQNNNNNIRSNSVAYNTGMGIHYEASQKALIARNRIFGNGQRGIYIPNSPYSIVTNNFVINNGMEGIAIVDERNAAAQNITALIPSGSYVAANVLGWNGKSDIVLPGDGVSSVSEANLFLGVTPTFAIKWPTPTNPIYLGLPAWLGATGNDIRSWHVSMPEPVQLITDLQQRKTTPNFSALDAVAAQYAVPLTLLPTPVPSGIGNRPGPQ